MTAFDRESLRAFLRRWSDVQRRIALERAVEQLDDRRLAELLAGLVRLDEHRSDAAQPPDLLDRVHAHAAATRAGEFLGDYRINAPHGERAPWQTAAWEAATSHLFRLALDGAERRDDGALDALRELVSVAVEVDERIDRLVVFEDDDCAALSLGGELDRARELLRPGERGS